LWRRLLAEPQLPFPCPSLPRYTVLLTITPEHDHFKAREHYEIVKYTSQNLFLENEILATDEQQKGAVQASN
jgi:hypothetical protein